MSQGWSKRVAEAVAFRHLLHSQPELTWQEHRTAALIRQQLTKLGIAWRPCATTGTVATLAPAASGTHVALRGDIDALPLQEQTKLPYQSQTPGTMHACGHDGHTATLLATAMGLKQHESSLPGPVSLLFQPAEEGGHGAKKMIDEGALQGVELIFGWHNWPAIPFGQALCPDGVVMAGNGTFHIEIRGHGGHSSQPELCRDPVLAAAAMTLNLQQIVSRRLAPQQSVVVSVTSIDARSGVTIVPDSAKVEGSFRVSNRAAREITEQAIVEIATSTAQSYGVVAEATIGSRYEATINHAVAAAQMRCQLQQVLGEAWQSSLATPVMASEDFSDYLQQIPGAFALIGSDDGESHHQAACHNTGYDFNDRLIDPVARVLMRLAGLETIV
ncbi:amidohydrolase [Ectothiorhodospiraceae bacterium BW-2]|nr:amidohydrolase [Ectothiorhodospiraceae bacterium BW-2]